MGTGRKFWYLVVIAAVAFAIGCESDDDDGGIDLTGWWFVESRPAGVGDFEPGSVTYLHQVGSEVSDAFSTDSLTLDGTRLTGTVNQGAPGDYMVIDLTVSQNSFSGTMTQYEGGVAVQVMDMRGTRRAAPTGTLTASAPYNLDSTTAYARADYSMGTLEHIGIEHVDATGWFRLYLDNFSSMGTDTYSVPSEIYVDIESDAVSVSVTSGTVTISSYTVDTAIAGSYDVTLSGGGTVTGTFDVLIELVTSY